ncbi:uncharacterized protein M421DRAFT_425228 [Didymella exigua CBS 183.55]|uniref:Uncharacterized protein n=1 Tax=Didymella exigua CBS 183.55 TaxID=1150837 RepID=A0A6A5R904_9PLEO|nr:uncharacterized protein M421DRAFT_425228 [Didymella exigua CBS 183.55]KAF1924043.1 hypothetical protein M421DRAFT_425228 [Didymella exigua CBS 183.55]
MSAILTRMNPKSVPNDYLFRYMDAAADYLMRFLEDQTQKQQDTYRCAVGQAICLIRTSERVISCLWSDLSGLTLADTANLEGSDPEQLLAAAAAVGCSSAVRHLLPTLTHPIQTSWTMGRPLTAAAINDQLGTADLLYKLPTVHTTNESYLWATIESCMGIENDDFIPQLLKWLQTASDICPDARQKRELRLYAIETGAVEVLRTVDTLGAVSANCGLYSSDFQTACVHGQTETIKYFTEADISAHPRWKRKRITCLTHGLRVTAGYGWFVAARYLVSKDADVNGQYDVQGLYVGTALDAAVYHNRLDMVELLLDSGTRVHVDEESSYGEYTLSTAREQGSEMARLISAAVGQKWGRESQEGRRMHGSRADDDDDALTDNMRDLYLRG